jgi:hypothetical protein
MEGGASTKMATCHLGVVDAIDYASPGISVSFVGQPVDFMSWQAVASPFDFRWMQKRKNYISPP